MLTLFYERVSTDRQSESGLGLEAQRRRNAQVADMYGRGEEFHAFVDDGVSASIPFFSRQQATELIRRIDLLLGVIEQAEDAGVKPPDFDVVVIAYSLDRLSRDVDDGRALMRWFDDRGVKVILSNEGGNAIDTSTAMGRFLITLRLAQGELERGLTSERTKAALGALQARGGKVGEPPYGWQRTEVRAIFEENADEQNNIRKILLFDEEELSAREIARRMNDLGVKTRDGKAWTHTQILRILGRAENGGEA